MSKQDEIESRQLYAVAVNFLNLSKVRFQLPFIQVLNSNIAYYKG